MRIFKVIQELEATSSRNEKEAILRRSGDRNVQKAFHYALNPLLAFGIKKIPQHRRRSPDVAATMRTEEMFDLLDSLNSKELTGNRAIEAVTKALEELHPDDAEVLIRILQRDPDCGVSTGTVNKVWKGLVPEYPVLLCSGDDEKNRSGIRYPAIVQTKYDGMRINFIVRNGTVEVRSRGGREIDLLGTFDEAILNLACGEDLVFDGEIIGYDEKGNLLPRKTSNGIVNHATKGKATRKELERLVFVAWDVIPVKSFFEGRYSVGYQDRFSKLSAMWTVNDSPILEMAESRMVNSYEEASEVAQDLIASGFEGVILKDPGAIWENKRSRQQIKMKAEREIDLEIVEVIEGTGKYEGMLGAIRAKTSDDEVLVKVGTGFSDEERSSLWRNRHALPGQIMAVIYNEVITKKDGGKKSLFLPRFVEVRFDKTEADPCPS